jgi:hypothetical protein
MRLVKRSMRGRCRPDMRSRKDPLERLARIPCPIISSPSTQGSFDFVASSLREEATTLKMTMCAFTLWLLRLGDALVVDCFENRISAAVEQAVADRFSELHGVAAVARFA